VVAARSVAATAVAMHMVVARVAVMVEADRAAARVGAGCCVRARANLRRR